MNNMDQHQKLLKIQEISQKLDIPKSTLRYWEKEFDGLFVPIRTNGGQRCYTSKDVSILEEIISLKKTGLSLIEIKGRLGKEQMPEAGSQRSGDEGADEIDLLGERVAEVVKMEVLRFFEWERGRPR